VRFESGRHRTAEKIFRAKHVVAAGLFAGDAGSTPAASTLRPLAYAWQATLATDEKLRVKSIPGDGEACPAE